MDSVDVGIKSNFLPISHDWSVESSQGLAKATNAFFPSASFIGTSTLMIQSSGERFDVL